MFTRCLAQAARRASSQRFGAHQICTQSQRIAASPAPRKFRDLKLCRPYSSGKATIDEVIEELQEQYATAKDEFEIAMEETEKMSVYAEEDRKAAREELDKLHEQYQNIINGPDTEMGASIQQRIGQRIRELDAAVKNMEHLAQNQD